MRGQVVEPVGQRQSLRISKALAHLFDAAVNVTAVDVHLLHRFAGQRNPETQHAVRSRVLRPDIDHVFVVLEQHVFVLFDLAVFQLVSRSRVERFVGIQSDRIDVRRSVVILAERIADPVVAQVQPAHIGVPDKADAEKIVHFAFVQVGRFPQVVHALQFRVLAVGGLRPEHDFVSQFGRTQVVNHAERFAPVHPGHAQQQVEPHLRIVPQAFRHVAELPGRHGHRQRLPFPEHERRSHKR